MMLLNDPNLLLSFLFGIAILASLGRVQISLKKVKKLEMKIDFIISNFNVDYPSADMVSSKTKKFLTIEHKEKFIAMLINDTGCSITQADKLFNQLMHEKISKI